ncbi:MAG: hypothetical protein ACT4PM_07040 [Gemmatimonadales bacterium]
MRSDRWRPAWPWFLLGGLLLAAGNGYAFLASRLGIGFAIPVGIVGLVSAAVITLAVTRRLRPPASSGLPDELAGQVLGELEEIRGRLQELEERMDFSERLLAQRVGESSPEQSRL